MGLESLLHSRRTPPTFPEWWFMVHGSEPSSPADREFVGFAKNQWMLEVERGWRSVDKFACADCFADEALRDLAEEYASENRCDYCGRSGESPIAAPM